MSTVAYIVIAFPFCPLAKLTPPLFKPPEGAKTLLSYKGAMEDYVAPCNGQYRLRACGAKAADGGNGKKGGRGGESLGF